ncbi:hypothetical protein [Haloimpatiens massiliensis]|nr:hypothetical protein [Haloimpatiens massiliensis]
MDALAIYKNANGKIQRIKKVYAYSEKHSWLDGINKKTKNIL